MHSSPRRDPQTGLFPEQVEFLDWLMSAERQGTQADWARAHDLNPTRISDWKRDDAAFQSAMNRRLREVGLGAEDLATTIRGLQKKAATGDSQAANALLAWMKFLSPNGIEKESEKDVEALTDAELEAELRRELGRVDEARADQEAVEPAPAVGNVGITPHQNGYVSPENH